ncbi:hypothetical protein VTO42DRAFT_7511 [Malbranchea cinnamomea]
MEIPPSYLWVKDHFDKVILDPSTKLNVPAIEKLQAELIAATDRRIPVDLLVQIAQLLPVLQEDPTPLTVLAIKAADYLDFSQIQSIQPPIDFLAGIKAPSPPINLLVLSLLKKAGNSASHAAIVAGNQDLIISLVELWLSTPVTEVAQAAFHVLSSLLEIDYPGQPKDESRVNGTESRGGGGQGLMWRRMFEDKDVYGLLFDICNLTETSRTGHIPRRQKTVAQGRLMELVLKAGSLDWLAITKSHFQDVESRVGSDSLLNFVACHMVEADDVLLHMTLIQFLSDLLRINAPGLLQRGNMSTVPCPPFSSPSLEFLLATGLHDRVMNYYIEPSALDPAVSTYLSGPVMSYVSQYALLYPNHLLERPQPILDKLLTRIGEAFDIPSVKWAHGPIPSGDLNLLASLPRVMLLEAGTRSLNPLLSIPPKPLHKDTLDTLGRIFHGLPKPPEKLSSGQQAVLEQNPTSPRSEAAAARMLYLHYLNKHPSLWANVVAAADIVAMQDTALAAIGLIKQIATANWEVIPADAAPAPAARTRFPLPTEDQVSSLNPSTEGNFPATGAWALLVPPALTTVMPYLFKPPQTYANFVAGGAGDTESAIWRIATAKYDALVSLHNTIERIGGDMNGMEELLTTLKRRVADGPWGPVSLVGSRVDALEL